MGVTIRNWSNFPSSIGDLSALTLDLVSQGRDSLNGLVESFPADFSIYPPATDSRTKLFLEDAGPDLLRLDGKFDGGSGRINELAYWDDVGFDGGDPANGEMYRLTGGNAGYSEASGFSGFFSKVEFVDYAEAYTASLEGKYFLGSGEGRFKSAEFRVEDGSGYRLSGDIRIQNGDVTSYSGVVRSLDIFGEGGERIATARGLKIQAADFGDDGPGSFSDEMIFAGNDNVTLGHNGVFFDAWGGKDRIRGGNGDDTLNGGDGQDVLTGGDGEDVFLFSASDSVGGAYARDQITDFRAADDLLVFDTDVFAALANPDYYDSVSGDFLFSAAEADGVLRYQRGVVFYDADGSSGAGDAVAVVKLAGNPSLSDSNFAAGSFTDS